MLFISQFITNRLVKENNKKFSRPIYILAIVSITIGIIVMILSLSIVQGYQQAISHKISGFGSHIQISNYDSNNSYETAPVDANQDLFSTLLQNPNVKHTQSFCLKAGILKLDDQIEGIVLKGVDNNYDWAFMNENMIEGTIPQITDSSSSTDILISKTIANKLKIDLNDKVQVYFIQEPPRVRVFKVCGIYDTGLGDFDKKYLFVDIKHIQKLNSWLANQSSGVEIILNDFSKLDETTKEIGANIPYNLRSQSIKQLYPDLFDWIELFDVNIIVLISIISIIGILTLTSTILIFILEQTSFIGIMKAMGCNNSILSSIFINLTSRILWWGIFWGNLISLILLFIQKYFKVIKLDAENYYIDHIPINLSFFNFAVVDICSVIVIIIAIFSPIYFVTRKVSTIKAISLK